MHLHAHIHTQTHVSVCVCVCRAMRAHCFNLSVFNNLLYISLLYCYAADLSCEFPFSIVRYVPIRNELLIRYYLIATYI